MPKTDGKFKPNGSTTQCQCVWDHGDPKFFTTMDQCTGTRAKDNNLFCYGCESAHGVQFRANEEAEGAAMK